MTFSQWAQKGRNSGEQMTSASACVYGWARKQSWVSCAHNLGHNLPALHAWEALEMSCLQIQLFEANCWKDVLQPLKFCFFFQIVLQTLLAFAITCYGIVHIAGEFKDMDATSELKNKYVFYPSPAVISLLSTVLLSLHFPQTPCRTAL